VKERPILFSGPMVKALLAGTKTQTRRIVKLRDGSLPDDASISTFEDVSTTGRGCYAYLWESINGSGSWAANPWVWVVTFKRKEPK
jgi:hypothetical protein